MVLTASEIGILIGHDVLNGYETFKLINSNKTEEELKQSLKLIKDEFID
jgi:hypothetical protein